jgi:hypothetical protein
MVETVIVVRKEHPCGQVMINKSDMTTGDVIYTHEDKTTKPIVVNVTASIDDPAKIVESGIKKVKPKK